MEILCTLPVELVKEIIAELDPVTLVSLAQSSKLFHQRVNPIRHDFERRLLIVELTEGTVPSITRPSRSAPQTTPPRNEDAWRNNKYACLGCMQLLPHYMFGEDMIMSLEYRKPVPGTLEAQRSQVTDWVAMPTGARWKLIKGRHEALRQTRIKMIQCGVDLLRPTVDTENQLAGISRHKRRFIECKYQKRTCNANPTTSDRLPAVMIGTLNITFHREYMVRWFPGVLDHSRVGRPPTEHPHPFSMVRCPGCQTWQEYRTFGHRLLSLERMPVDRQCYRCYVKMQERNSSTALSLCHHLLERLDICARLSRSNFFDNWDAAEDQFSDIGASRSLKRPDFELTFESFWNGPWTKTVEVLEKLRPIFEEHRREVNSLPQPCGFRTMYLYYWILDYDDREAELLKFVRQIEIVTAVCEQEPEVILDYFTQPNPFYWTANDDLEEAFELVDGVVVRRDK
ncbi:hypothetical protein QBC43DRAFT_18366 [Cladorrhinum sp. PSN259]|nr:hypothetical protein QBC43DRAFT_18366 [Cladorrhinum sp. PSN259]